MKELITVQKKLSVPKDKKGGTGNYKYRSVDDILEAVKKIMPDGCYITMTDSVENIGGRNYICATAIFSSGENSISCQGVAWEPEKLAAMSIPQITGSCSSYARKSALCGLFMIDDSKDIDSLSPGEVGSVKLATESQIAELTKYSDDLKEKDPERSEYIDSQLADDNLSYTKARKILERLK